jgi:hypothetical protein
MLIDTSPSAVFLRIHHLILSSREFCGSALVEVGASPNDSDKKKSLSKANWPWTATLRVKLFYCGRLAALSEGLPYSPVFSVLVTDNDIFLGKVLIFLKRASYNAVFQQIDSKRLFP